MFELMFWGVFTRTGQIAVEASVTILIGLFVAGVMRRMLGSGGIRRLLGGKGWKGLLRAWGVGMLLPVCSLGVIPIARELRRSGVPSGTILAFVLAAPHINPLSLLYGLTLSEPVVIVCFAASSLILAITAGAVWERFFAKEEDTIADSEEVLPAPGLRRLLSVVVTAAKESVNPCMGFVLAGLVFTGLVSGLLPHGSLAMTMRHDDPTSPAMMTLIATPLYTGPLQGMMRLGLIFEHGNSVGAAFSLFELGIGVNLGLMVWLTTIFGFKRVVGWFALILLATLCLGYLAEKPLYFAKEEASHTHAFDDWTSPYVSGIDLGYDISKSKIAQKIELLEPIALVGLAICVCLGTIIRIADRQGVIERWLTERPGRSDAPDSIWNRGVPGPILGVVALLVLVVFSIAALYVFYPPPEQAFAEIIQVRTEALIAVRTEKAEEAIRQLERWDLLTRKLQVGAFLRTGKLDPEASQSTEELREQIEELRDAMLAKDFQKSKEILTEIESAHRKFRDHFLRREQSAKLNLIE